MVKESKTYKTVQKYLILLAALVLIVSLAGCTGTTVSPSTATTPVNTSAATTTVTATPPPITTTISPYAGKELSVFAGSASKPALDEAAAAFEKQTGARIFLTYGGSGTVLSQMELSKTGDIYIPGSPDYLVKSNKKNITDPSTMKIIAYLVPAICVQSGNPKNIQTLSDLAQPGVTVGIGNPGTVCVGLYAVEILDRNQLLADVYKNIVTQAASCDNTASLISLKSVDAIMGWNVFHAWDPENIDTIYLKPEQISRLAYIPAAISTFCKETELAAAFIEFLVSPTGQEIFRKWGYDVTEEEVRKYAPDAEIGGEYQLPESYQVLIQK
jgi:molybdate transport system substrate-binding protein